MSKKHGPGPNLFLTRILALLFLKTLVRQVRTQKVNPAASGKSLIKKTLQTLSFLPLSSLTHSKLSLSLKPSPNPSLLLLLLSLSLTRSLPWSFGVSFSSPLSSSSLYQGQGFVFLFVYLRHTLLSLSFHFRSCP